MRIKRRRVKRKKARKELTKRRAMKRGSNWKWLPLSDIKKKVAEVGITRSEDYRNWVKRESPEGIPPIPYPAYFDLSRKIMWQRLRKERRLERPRLPKPPRPRTLPLHLAIIREYANVYTFRLERIDFDTLIEQLQGSGVIAIFRWKNCYSDISNQIISSHSHPLEISSNTVRVISNVSAFIKELKEICTIIRKWDEVPFESRIIE